MTVTDLTTFTTTTNRATSATTPGRARRLVPHVRPVIVECAIVTLVLGTIALLGAAWIDTSASSWFASLRTTRWMDGASTIFGAGWAGVCLATGVASAIV